jgi:hypothetical protein
MLNLYEVLVRDKMGYALGKVKGGPFTIAEAMVLQVKAKENNPSYLVDTLPQREVNRALGLR